MPSISILRVCLFVLFLSIPSTAAFGWQYSPDGDDATGSLTGGTQGTLSSEHPMELNGQFLLYKKGLSTLFVDSITQNAWVKTPLPNGTCAWEFYASSQKFQDKYFLGTSTKQFVGNCNKP
jgi:hypothetical protein